MYQLIEMWLGIGEILLLSIHLFDLSVILFLERETIGEISAKASKFPAPRAFLNNK